MQSIFELFIPEDDSRETKDFRHRLKEYAQYLVENSLKWYEPDLESYKAHLQNDRQFANSTVLAHLITVRNRYKHLVSNGIAEKQLRTELGEDTNSVYKAMDRLVTTSKMKFDDISLPDTEVHNYPSQQELESLFKQDIHSLQDIRDILLLGLPLCAGMTESEVCTLIVENIHPSGIDTVNIEIPQPNAEEKRVVPVYDVPLFNQRWIKYALDLYKFQSRRNSGELFSGFFRGGHKPRSGNLSLRGYQRALEKLGTQADLSTTFTALDLRRTYARRLYQLEVSIEELQANLGHGKQLTTRDYIGPPSRSDVVEPIDILYTLDQLHKYEREHNV
ncbi:MAG: site-specific integrase [Aggregatilineales bacterium]